MVMGARLDLSFWRNFLESQSRKTRENYEDGINHFLEANGWSGLEEALAAVLSSSERAEKAILNMVSRLRDLGRSNTTIRLYLSAVRSLYSLYEVPANWVRLKKFFPKKTLVKELKPVPKNVLAQVIPLLKPSKRLLIWFLFATGCRIGEAITLRVRDLDLSSDPPKARVVTEKTGVPRIVFIPRDLAERLRDWVKEKDPEHFLFHSERGPEHPLNAKHVRRAFQGALMRLGYLKRDPSNKGWNYSIHGLRRSFKTILQNAGMTGLMIEILLGHDVGISASYYRPSEKDLAEEWKKFEHHLLLESPGLGLSSMEREMLIKMASLAALEQTWSALNPGQSPEDLYVNAARFELGHYPDLNEKITILKTALSSYISFVKDLEHSKLKKALREK